MGSLPGSKQVFRPPEGVERATSFTRVVHNLHKAIAYFVRVQADAEEKDMVRHHFALLEYARCMEKVYGVTTMHTSNLHTAICRLLV